MTVSVFIGASVDGFIARPNDDLDFLPEGGGERRGSSSVRGPAARRSPAPRSHPPLSEWLGSK
ncbi:MAG TPA: hypothetical protein VMO76_04230 [Candidatus Udaeobacter sp.]|nr:hypothetical protein [Candidatus Udaeobacter sp.]